MTTDTKRFEFTPSSSDSTYVEPDFTLINGWVFAHRNNALHDAWSLETELPRTNLS